MNLPTLAYRIGAEAASSASFAALRAQRIIDDMKRRRVGIYPGTFDPVHAGHIAFALQAVRRADLDELYFLPERRPRHKMGVEHFAHRVAMLRRAAAPHPAFDVLELEDVSFSVDYTLPRLKRRLRGAQLVFLFGSDAARRIGDWPSSDRLLRHSELVVGMRSGEAESDLRRALDRLPVQPKRTVLFPSHAPSISSGKVRDGLRRHISVDGLLKSVERYSDNNWLYVSLAGPVVDKP